MERYKIMAMDVVSPDFALAAGKKSLLQWDGENWSVFRPQIPLQEYYITKIKAFSPKNIWIFYKRHEFIYHTDIMHFNGLEWNSIPTPQPYDIMTFSFIDSARFFAAGAWGSLFFYDGKRSTNIKTPRGVPNHQITDVVGFTNEDFLIVLQNNEYEKRESLYKFSNGKWQQHYLEHNIKDLYFYSPDSGLVVGTNGVIYQFDSGLFSPIDTLIIHNAIYPVIDICDDTIYYSSDGTIYRYHNFENHSFFSIDFDAQISHIRGKEFFLLDRHRRLYYLGRSNHGMEVKKENPKFSFHYFVNQGPSGHIGVSLYPNTKNSIDLYFVNPVKPNLVYTPQSDREFVYNDIATRRGLIGEHEKILWDGGLYFADIDNDQDLDAILAALKGNSLMYENVGNDQFLDVTAQYDFNLKGRISTIYWCDLNLDENLDFMAGDETGPIRSFIGNGFYEFLDVTHDIGIPDSLISYMPATLDADGDGDLDLLLYSQYDRIRFLQNQGITPRRKLPMFVDRSELSPDLTTRFDFFTQSVACGDYDNDGDFDLFLANRVTGLKLFENDGMGVFRDVSPERGFEQRFLSYGANWGDLNQDGHVDLFVATLGKNYIFWNREGHFFDIDSTSLPDNELAYSTGSVLEDLDGDGDLDIIVANNEIGVSCIYENLSIKNSALKIQVQNQAGNRFGIGSQIYAYEANHLGDSKYLYGVRQISTNQGYCSGGLPTAHFGLRADKKYDILVKFPTGEEVTVLDLSVPNEIIVSGSLSFDSRVERLWTLAKSLFLHPGRRPISFQFIAFLLILISFNVYLYRFSTWQKEQKLFFNFLSISVLFLFYIFLSPTFQKIIPVVIYAALTGSSFYGVDRYLRLKRSDTNPFQLYRLLQQFNHGEIGRRQLDRLRYFANNLADSNHQELSHEMVAVEVENFKKYTVPLLKEVNSSLTPLNLPVPMIRRLEKHSNDVMSKCDVLTLGKDKFSKNLLQQYGNSLNILVSELSLLKNEIQKMVSCVLLETVADGLNKFPRFTNVSVTKPELTDDLRVIMPRVDLMQVLSNIFQNSLDAMKDRKSKKISISIGRVANGTVTMTIKDNGPGISPKIRNQIFNESFSTKQQSGVGLFHARELLRHYGGDIRLMDHSSKKEACFEIKLMVLNYDGS